MSTTAKNFQGSFQQQQRGAVLIVAMLLLLVLTMLGVMGLSNMTLEERMAAGYQQEQVVFDASESVINQIMLLSGKDAWSPTQNMRVDCNIANGNPGNCTVAYNANNDVMSTLLSGACYQSTNLPPIEVDASTNVILNANAVTAASVQSLGSNPDPKAMPGFDLGETGFAPQTFVITAATTYQVGPSTTATASQTQRVSMLAPADSACPMNP